MYVQLERKQHNHFVREAWVKQVKEKQEERAKAEQEQLEAMKECEAMQLAEEERRRAEHQQTRERAVALQLQLKQQVEALRLYKHHWMHNVETICVSHVMWTCLTLHPPLC